MAVSIPTILAVAGGGALGAVSRYGVGVAMGRWLGHGFPVATLTVNIVGSFAMGVLIALLAHYGGGQTLRAFLAVGFLGAFTTFSAFSLDTILLVERGQTGLAAIYVAGSVIGSVAGLFLGLHLIRQLVAS
ncbi:MAG: fluoride efflux transporter CrcB [Alphaproteobacteria bacterium]|nr:fluoride efflux transporter CrcB [Alphaproteobacteria bacterium SS10]